MDSGEKSQEPIAHRTSTATGLLMKPLEYPSQKSQIPPSPSLSEEQKEKYDNLLKDVRSWTVLPTTSAKNAPTTPIVDHERMWLTRDCLLRYLRASNWNLPTTMTRLRATLVWRREYGEREGAQGVESLDSEYISIENETGKQIQLGFDTEGRPCLYLNPSKQNTKTSPKQLHHLVYMLERTIDVMPPGQDTLALLINFKEMSSGQNPGIAQGRQTMNILQNHYPERLGRACVVNIPWFFWTFYKIITPFIDPVTRSKLKFNEETNLYVPSEQLLVSHGGVLRFEYNHVQYWPALTALAAARRREQRERWIAAGSIIGESEMYLRSGDERFKGGRDGLGPDPEVPAPLTATGSETGVARLDVQEAHSGAASTDGSDDLKAPQEVVVDQPATQAPVALKA